MKKVFLSLPMKDRTEEAILDTIGKMKEMIHIYYPNEELEFHHNYNPLLTKELEQLKNNYPNMNKNDSVWYLGEAIKILAGCDMLVEIGEGGRYIPYDSNGCWCERFIAKRYGIPVKTLSNVENYFTPDILPIPNDNKAVEATRIRQIKN